MAQTTGDEIINTYEISPDLQKAEHQLSISLTGEKASLRHTREEIIKQHYQNIQHIETATQDPSSNWTKQIVLPIAYPPSVIPLDELKQISFSDLKLETHHHGIFITATTITPPYNFSNTITIIQEASKNIAILLLNFLDDTTSPLPQNSTVAIKEPYIQSSSETGYIIRVDHPSDIAVLRGDDPAVNLMLESVQTKKNISPKEWKVEGDKSFVQKKYGTAIECYTQALATPSDNLNFTRDTYHKRAFANLLSEHFPPALQDAFSSCNNTVQDSKSYFMAARAACSLHSYSESKTYLEKALELTPTDPKLQNELKKVHLRIQEQENGNYDFSSMISENQKKGKIYLDHANFTSNIEIRQTPHAGRGLFTRMDVEAGEILLVEKAFCLPDLYTGNEEESEVVLYNFNNNSRTQKTSQTMLFSKLVQKLYKHSHLCAEFYELDSGGYESSGKEGKLVDGVPVIDSFLIEAIRNLNSFSSPLFSRHLLKRTCPPSETHLTSGIWSKASYTNHSCIPNCARAFIGDIMIVRSLHPIPKDTEITHSYISPDASPLYRRTIFPATWDFVCTCKLCAGEARSMDERHEERVELAKKINRETVRWNPSSGLVSGTNVKMIEKLLRKLEGFYEEDVYGDLPRLLLVNPGIWLMEVYRAGKNHAKMVKSALDVLRNFGFGSIERGDLELNWGNGIVNTDAFNALRCAAEGCNTLGKAEMAAKCREGARRMFLVLSGSEVGMEGFME